MNAMKKLELISNDRGELIKCIKVRWSKTATVKGLYVGSQTKCNTLSKWLENIQDHSGERSIIVGDLNVRHRL